MTTLLKQVRMYTDGACLKNPGGPGGWAAILFWNNNEGKEFRKEISGNHPGTTNNRMEMTAAINGLKLLKVRCAVTIYSDSDYLVKGMEQWLYGWKRNGWTTRDGKPVVNRDLWEQLDAEAEKHVIIWQWIKGHDGNRDNERVDKLANTAARYLAVTSRIPTAPILKPEAIAKMAKVFEKFEDDGINPFDGEKEPDISDLPTRSIRIED